MKKVTVVMLIVCMGFLSHVNAQVFASAKGDIHKKELKDASTSNSKADIKTPTFSFFSYQLEERLQQLPSSALSSHFLGEKAARRVCLFNQEYKQQVPIAPGNPAMKTVYRKPVLVKAVKKIESQLKKEVKKNIRTIDEATTLYNKTMDVAINVVSEDTKAFEKAVREAKDVQVLIALFQNTTLNQY